MLENVAAAIYPVGVHNFSCVLVFKNLDTLKPPRESRSTCQRGHVMNTNLRNRLKIGNFEIASRE